MVGIEDGAIVGIIDSEGIMDNEGIVVGCDGILDGDGVGCVVSVGSIDGCQLSLGN